MITPKVGFIVYGVHKDGLVDPMGAPFIDDQLIANAKNALRFMAPVSSCCVSGNSATACHVRQGIALVLKIFVV